MYAEMSITPTSNTMLSARFAARDGTQTQEQQQAQEGNGHELAVSAAGIFSEGIALDADVLCATKEVLELHQYEGRKQQRDGSQDYGGFRESQHPDAHRHPIRQQGSSLILGGSVQKNAQERPSRGKNVDQSENEFRQPFETEQTYGRVQLMLEYQVGGAKQDAEYEQNGQCQEHATQNRPQPGAC
jgi:hypothetical protein